MSRAELVDHLRSHALVVGAPIRLRSGAVSNWYVDARRTTFDGRGAAIVGAAVLDALEPGVTAVGGMTMGADPIAVATALVAHQRGRLLHAFSVRTAAKSHGMGGRLVGPMVAGDRVAVLEDTTTTGGALGEALDVVTAADLEVVQVIALVDRSGGSVAAAMAGLGLPFVALVTPADLGVEP